MSPHSWATPEQDAFMLEFYDDFIKCQAKRDYSIFWLVFYERWFAQFLERAVVFPEIPLTTVLSEDQKAAVGKGVEARKDQLRNRLRNRWGASKKTRQAKDLDVKSCASLISGIMKSHDGGRSRKPQKIEAYLNLYYEDRIKPAIKSAHDVHKDEALTTASSDESKKKLSSKLGTIMSKTREMFLNEMEEVKAKVEERWKEMVAEKSQPDSESQESTQFYINKLAGTLSHFLEGLRDQTGWSFSVLMGGPNPDSGGNIEAGSVHVGTTELKHMFDQVYQEFNSTIMQPYRSFLDKVVVSKAGMSNGTLPVEHGSADAAENPEKPLDVPAPADCQTANHSELVTNATENAEAPPANHSELVANATENAEALPAILDGSFVNHAPQPSADNFYYDFGNPMAIQPLDDFLANYPAPLVISTPSGVQSEPLPPTINMQGPVQMYPSDPPLTSAIMHSQPLMQPSIPPAFTAVQPQLSISAPLYATQPFPQLSISTAVEPSQQCQWHDPASVHIPPAVPSDEQSQAFLQLLPDVLEPVRLVPQNDPTQNQIPFAPSNTLPGISTHVQLQVHLNPAQSHPPSDASDGLHDSEIPQTNVQPNIPGPAPSVLLPLQNHYLSTPSVIQPPSLTEVHRIVPGPAPLLADVATPSTTDPLTEVPQIIPGLAPLLADITMPSTTDSHLPNMQPVVEAPQSVPAPQTLNSSSKESNKTWKHIRQPSKRNEVANSIGAKTGTSKKRGAGNGGNVRKKKKTE